MIVPYYSIIGREIANCFSIESFYLSVNRVFEASHDYSGEAHDFWEVVYVNDGEVEVTEDGNVYLLGEGDIIFHAPMEFHCIKSYRGSTPNVLNLSFGSIGECPKNLLSGVFHLDEKERKEFLKICEDVKEWLDNKGEDALFGQEISARWLAFMLRLNRTYQHQNKKVSAERVLAYRRMVEIMHEEVLNNISISQVAEKLFVSVSYVKVLFNRYAGISPKSYYTNLQINEAMKFLDEGKSVREIAERMNFSTSSYFSVFFKKNTGMAPKQYKNMKK